MCDCVCVCVCRERETERERAREREREREIDLGQDKGKKENLWVICRHRAYIPALICPIVNLGLFMSPYLKPPPTLTLFISCALE